MEYLHIHHPSLQVEEADPDASGEVQYSKLMSVFRDMQKGTQIARAHKDGSGRQLFGWRV